MESTVQFFKDFGLDSDWQDLTFGNIPITDFELAIKLVMASGFNNIQLRQDKNGSTIEWDNF